MYQSYKVLRSPSQYLRPHNAKDDLESFFYVLCHVLFEFSPDLNSRYYDERSQDVLEQWAHTNVKYCITSKSSFIQSNIWFDFHDTLGEMPGRLLERLRLFFQPMVFEVHTALRSGVCNPMATDDNGESYFMATERDYSDFLKIVDEEIVVLGGTPSPVREASTFQGSTSGPPQISTPLPPTLSAMYSPDPASPTPKKRTMSHAPGSGGKRHKTTTSSFRSNQGVNEDTLPVASTSKRTMRHN
jgi:hypothetical protein